MILEAAGFTNITIGDAVDTFGQSSGEGNARTFEVFGYSFLIATNLRRPNPARDATALTQASVRMLRRRSHDEWISTGSTMWTGACTSNHGSITDQW